MGLVGGGWGQTTMCDVGAGTLVQQLTGKSRKCRQNAGLKTRRRSVCRAERCKRADACYFRVSANWAARRPGPGANHSRLSRAFPAFSCLFCYFPQNLF